LLRQKKVAKEKATPVAAPRNISAVPCASREERARDQLAGGRKTRPLGLDTVSRNPALSPAMLGWLTGVNNSNSNNTHDKLNSRKFAVVAVQSP
jgi:hypothetical protein